LSAASRQDMSSFAIESRSMEERGRLENFSLLGGPLHWLGRRLGLVRGETNTVALGLALGLLSWSILLALASIGGVSHKLFSLSAIAVDVRLLVVIPLFFLCESSLDPRLRDFVSTIVRSGVVPSNALPALESEIACSVRWKDAWLPEAMCLLAAALLSLFAAQLHLSGKTAALDPTRSLSDVPFTGLWYWIVCLPLFRFPDLQSLADLSNSVGIVRNMRWVPVSTRLLVTVVIAALLPMLPLLLFKYPIAELVQRVLSKLAGL
jgi:hypothetical protein